MVLPGVTVGHHALVAAQACVTKNMPPNMLVAGAPARIVGETSGVKLRDGRDRSAYPWTTHFTRGYPVTITEKWSHRTEYNDD